MNNKSTNKSMPKDNRPPKHLRTLKQGHIRDDGMVFWGYHQTSKNGEQWMTRETYKEKRANLIENKKLSRSRDNRPPKHLRTLRRGDVREDGMIFFLYSRDSKNGECWLTKDVFDDRVKRQQESSKKYAKNNRGKLRDYFTNRRKNNPIYRLIKNQRTRINSAIKSIRKTNNTLSLIGCSSIELKDYIESKFEDNMSWENYGKYGWHIDHVRPCASFDLSDPEQQEECFHYTNLQPLWAKDNLSKGSHYNPQTED